MAVNIIITNAGRAALVNAQNTGTNPVTITQIGLTAASFTATPAHTALPSEARRISTVSGAVVADDTIHLTARDESTDSYSVRGFALYLGDGTLFAIYSQSAILVQKSSQSMFLLAVDVKFADIAAAAISFGNTDFLLPPATKTVQGVVELATEAEVQSGTDDSRAVTPKDNKTAFNAWLNTRFGADAPSPLLKDILALALAEDVRTALGLKSAALKAEGAGGGLNADLLDGQHGAYYADIPTRLGFTPMKAADFTAAAVLAMLLGVDGAGSGIDADLLDGQQGSYYTNIPARLGFTPLNATNYTAADVLAKLNSVDGAGSGIDADMLDGYQASAFLQAALFTGAQILTLLTAVDGSGSGLDADLLDGQQGSYYTNIPARLGFTPLNATTYTAADVLAKILTVDGSGSGLDADTVDGMQASEFATLASFTGSNQLLAANGYQKLPGGLIIQSGRLSISSNASVTITWPVAFPTDCLAAVANSGEVDSARNENQAAFYDWRATYGRIYNGLDKTNAARWIAIGY